MTKVTTMSIELLLFGSVLVFLLKTAVYTAAACFVVRYSVDYVNKQ